MTEPLDTTPIPIDFFVDALCWHLRQTHAAVWRQFLADRHGQERRDYLFAVADEVMRLAAKRLSE